jgi:peptidyl-prolyl cis-trans isomerase SurA
LSEPYLENKVLLDSYVKESYKRMQEEINASQILVSVNFDSHPEDSTKAYKKAMEVRQRIIAGEPFEEVANSMADGNSKVNGGKLGWFTANKMVYPFETACYNLKVGEISMPVKTQYGYHIIRVNGRQKNKGELAASHIIVFVPKDATDLDKQAAKQKIEKAYAELKAGTPWGKVVETYSEHERTKKKEGRLGYINRGMSQDFLWDTLYNLKPGAYSAPFKSEAAYHILKLDDIKPIEPFDSLKSSMTDNFKISVEYVSKSEEELTEKILKEYGSQKFFENVKPFYSLVDSSIYVGKWDYKKAKDMVKPVFTVGNKTYNQYEFAKYINDRGFYNRGIALNLCVDDRFEEFINEKAAEYEKENLPSKYPELKNLLDEYHDGILLFNLTEEKVWKKAIDDTAGLKKFYDELPQKYSWGERVKISKYIYADSSMINALLKLAKKNAKNPANSKLLSQQLCPKDSLPCVAVTELKYEKGDNAVGDSITWKAGAYLQTKDKDKFVLLYVDSILPSQIKKLQDARGLYTADYQNYLEKKWIDELRNRYVIKINNEVLENIKKEQQ